MFNGVINFVSIRLLGRPYRMVRRTRKEGEIRNHFLQKGVAKKDSHQSSSYSMERSQVFPLGVTSTSHPTRVVTLLDLTMHATMPLTPSNQ